MKLRRPLLAHLLLFVGFLSAFGFLGYYPTLHIAEIGEVGIFALFLWVTLSTKMDSRWTANIFLPAIGLAFFVVLYAYVFTIRENTPLLPSILAQRYDIFFLLGPIVYALYIRGWVLKDFRQAFVSALLLTVVSAAAYDIFLSSSSILLPGNILNSRLEDNHDPAQVAIFRLLHSSALFLALYFGRGLSQTRGLLSFLFRLAITVLSAALFMFGLPRGLLASFLVALILYAIFLSRPGQPNLLAILFPLIALATGIVMPTLSSFVAQSFNQDLSYEVRRMEVETAWSYFLQHPLFGAGQDSLKSISFQDLYGIHFYQSDIGLLGVAFQFGLVGLVLYVVLVVWLCAALLKLLWAYAGKLPLKESSFLWALFLVYLTFLVASPLQARFIYSEGVPIAAFSWGLLMAHRYGLSNGTRRQPPKRVASSAADDPQAALELGLTERHRG